MLFRSEAMHTTTDSDDGDYDDDADEEFHEEERRRRRRRTADAAQTRKFTHKAREAARLVSWQRFTQQDRADTEARRQQEARTLTHLAREKQLQAKLAGRSELLDPAALGQGRSATRGGRPKTL